VAEIVATRKAVQQQRSVEVFFIDESHFTNEPSGQRGWFRKGKQVKSPGPSKRQSTTLFGALHLKTPRAYWQQAPRGPSKRFREFLSQLHQRFPNVLMLLIFDNAKMHKSRAVKRFVKQHDWVAREHLEPYSPEYNPIERFWKWRKATVYGATAFETMAEVIHKVRQIIWHYNERWLKSTIYFEFEPYQEIL
jgi:transposase